MDDLLPGYRVMGGFLLRPTRDAKPRAGSKDMPPFKITFTDQMGTIRPGELQNVNVDRDSAQSGAELVLELDGPASAYFIATNNGKTALYRSASVSGTMDPGELTGTNGGGTRAPLITDAAKGFAGRCHR